MKITYATLRADNEELHALYEAGLTEAKRQLDGHHRNFVGGSERVGDGETTVTSPIDRNLVLGHFARGTRQDVRDAIEAARKAQPAWAATPWRDRLAIIRKAAELISERQMVYGGLMAIEVGKTRLEALGEVEEAADLFRYYSQTFEDNNGYDHPMDNLGDSAVHTRSILRPHGVFAVISPFNFPMALSAGPTSAALIAGNAAILKPSSAAPMSANATSRVAAAQPTVTTAASSTPETSRRVMRLNTIRRSDAAKSPRGCAVRLVFAARRMGADLLGGVQMYGTVARMRLKLKTPRIREHDGLSNGQRSQ